jgi:hypothetical protein
MEPEGSLPHSQVPATCLYSVPAKQKPSLYRLLTFQVPNLTSLFLCVGSTKISVQVRDFVCEYFVTRTHFHGEKLLDPRPTPKLEDHSLSAVRDSFFNIFAASLNTGGGSSIRIPRTRHATLTGTHLSHGCTVCKLALTRNLRMRLG